MLSVTQSAYNDAHGAAFGVQKNHCSEYPWYCDTPGDPSTEQARYPGSGIYMNGDTTAPVLFEKCLGVAPDATIIYDISGLNAVKFESDIGVEFTKLEPWKQTGGDVETNTKGRCQFEIYADSFQINYQNRPVRVTYLNYGDFFKWWNNQKEGIPAYMVIDMVTQEAEVAVRSVS